jgi:acetylornithine deacetylase/succinyl-diaminopimelate desuccinylase-like protein
MEKTVDFINVNRDRYVDELKQYLAIPSISALPQHKDDVRRCAEWTADEMRRIGLNAVRLDHPFLWPLRRAAGGPRQSVDVATVRGDDTRR